MLHFGVVAKLIDCLTWIEFLPVCRVEEWNPEIGIGEDGICALEGGHEGVFVVQVGLDHFDTLCGPGLSLGWISGYATDLPAGFFGVQFCDGAAL